MSKINKIIIFLICIILLSTGGYFGFIYCKAKNTLDDIYVPIKKNKTEKAKKENPSEKPISILLLGIDGKGTKGNRSDTIIVLTMNPKEGRTTMVSIPRDSRTEIVGKGYEDKINHAYAFGGPQMAIDTVENFLNIPIDYFVSVDMNGFKEIVDIFGGVTVTNNLAFSYGGYSFQKGNITLNGDEALAYARMRKEDPRGDLGRNDRQKQIIEALMKKAANITSVSKAEEILNMVRHNVQTNLKLSDMKMLQQYYDHSKEKTQILSLSGVGQKINNIWYFIVDEESKQQVSNELKTDLTDDSVMSDKDFVY